MKTRSIDIETYSSAPLQKSGVYRYVEAEDFEILLFGYSVDSGPVQVVDLAYGEHIPKEILQALEDEEVIKWAFNATFERNCLSRYLGYPTGDYLNPESWRCSMIWAATMGLPLSLEGVGAVLGLEKQKLTEGKDLIKYFCQPWLLPNPMASVPETDRSMRRISGTPSRNITFEMWKRKWPSSSAWQSSRYRLRSGRNTTRARKSTTLVCVWIWNW